MSRKYTDVVCTGFELREGSYGPYAMIFLQSEAGEELVKFMNLPKTEGQQKHWIGTCEALGLDPKDPLEGPFGKVVATAVEEFNDKKDKFEVRYINKPRSKAERASTTLDAAAARDAIKASLGSVNPF